MTVAHLGDSSALLVRQDGQIKKLTSDHHPSRQDEFTRISQKGGYISFKNGVARVDGCLAVSRAIGDIQHKQFVISEPEVITHELESADDLLLLTTDGLLDVFSLQELRDLVKNLRHLGLPAMCA